MSWLYQTLCYQPLFNILIYIYTIFPIKDLGISIVLLTILIRLILYPFSRTSIRAQKRLQELQPKVDEIRKVYSGQNDKIAKELMELYKQEKVNPFSSCLPLLIQIPFLIALYQVFRQGIQSVDFSILYPFVAHPQSLNLVFLGVLHLATPSALMAVLAAVAQYIQTAMLPITPPVVNSKGAQDEKMMATMNKQMRIIAPIMTLMIGLSFPAGLALYWLVNNCMQILQQWLVFRKHENV